MTIPQTIPILGSPALANFAAADIASGVSYNEFYGSANKLDAGELSYGLSTVSQVAAEISTSGTASLTTTFTKYLDLDFDTSSFVLPRTMKGDAIVTVTHSLASNSAAIGSDEYILVSLIKWDGTTETTLASVSGSVISSPATVADEAISIDILSETFKLPISRTHFKIGDVLRLNIQNYVKCGSGSPSAIWRIYHDPGDRSQIGINFNVGTSGAVTSKIIANLPFIPTV